MRYPKEYRDRSGAGVPPAVIDVGRKLLGYLENQRRLGGVQTLRAQKELTDGTIVRAMLINGNPVVEYILPGSKVPVVLPCKYYLETGQIDLVNKELTFGTTSIPDDHYGGLQGPAAHDGKVFYSGNRYAVPPEDEPLSPALRAAKPLKRDGQPDYVFADKDETQERLPPSLWTGLMRLYVQSMYGDPEAQYGYVSHKNMRASRIGTRAYDIQPYVDLLAVPCLNNDGTKDILWLNPGFQYGFGFGNYAETYSPGIPGTFGMSQVDDFTFYVVEVYPGNTLFRKLVFDECGLRILKLRAGLDDNGGLDAVVVARKVHLLAYAFTRSIIKSTPEAFAGNSWADEVDHVPFGRYGWKFNSDGSEMSIVTFEPDPAPFAGPGVATDPDFLQSVGPRQKIRPVLRKLAITYTLGVPTTAHTVVETGAWIGMNSPISAERFPWCWMSETARSYSDVTRSDRLSRKFDPGAYEGASAFENNTYDVPVYCFYKNDDTLEVIRWYYEPIELLPGTTNAERVAAGVDNFDNLYLFSGEFKDRSSDRQVFDSGFYCSQYTTVGRSTCDNSGFYGPLELVQRSFVYLGDGVGGAATEAPYVQEWDASCSHLAIPFGDANAVYMQKAVCQGYEWYTSGIGTLVKRDWDETYTGKIVHAYGTPFDLEVFQGSATPYTTGVTPVFAPSGLTERNNGYGPTLEMKTATPLWATSFAGNDFQWVPWATRSASSYQFEGCHGYGARIVTSYGGASVYCHDPLNWAPASSVPDSIPAPAILTVAEDYNLTATHDYLNKRATSFLGWS